jgi:hypothetical protein
MRVKSGAAGVVLHASLGELASGARRSQARECEYRFLNLRNAVEPLTFTDRKAFASVTSFTR